MSKINKIDIQGDNNIVLQDVSGQQINININKTEDIKKLLTEYSGSLDFILSELQKLNTNLAQRLSQQINIYKANITGENINIQAQNVTVTKSESKASKYVKYLVFFFILPVLFIALVFYLKPFNVTVKLTEINPIPGLKFTQGTLILTYGDKSDTIVTNGEAIFKQIPAIYRNRKVRLQFTAQGYEPVDTQITLKPVINLNITRDNSLATITGQVVDEQNRPLPGVIITVKNIKVRSDSSGMFTVNIPRHLQAPQQRLTAYKPGYQLWDFTFPVIKGKEIRIVLKRQR